MNPGNMTLQFRFVERQLELQISEVIEAPLPRIVEMICNPELRVEWDEMFSDHRVLEREGDNKRIVSSRYVRDGCTLPVILRTEVHQGKSAATIRSLSLPDDEAVRLGYEPGHNVSCIFTIEPLRQDRAYSVDARRQSCDGDEQMKWFTVSVNVRLCLHISRQLMPLVYEEDMLLQRCMTRLKSAAEGSNFWDLQSNDSLSAVLERKVSGQLLRRKKFRSLWSPPPFCFSK
jgi:hypothetical protein